MSGPPPMSARNERMAVLYATGLHDLARIGAAFGVTRERARQIVRAQEARTGFSAHEARRAGRLDRSPRRPTPLERFFDKVRLNHETGCWEWTGARNPVSGYAIFNCDGEQYAHRFSVLTFKSANAYASGDGPLYTNHLCRTRHCVNPDHLEVVTPRETVSRSARSVYSQAALIQMLRWLALRLNRTPTVSDINSSLPCSIGPYISRFGRISTAQGIVGLLPNDMGHSAPLPPSFRAQHAHLLSYQSADEVAEQVGGLKIPISDLVAA